MKRTTILTDDQTTERLAGIARLRGVPLSRVIREALAEYVYVKDSLPAGALPSFVGAGASGRSDIAERAEDLLWSQSHENNETS